MVMANGAIRRLLPWNVSLTELSTKSTIISTTAWNLPGLPDDDFFAALRNSVMKTRPSNSDQNIESTLIAIGLPAQWFHTHSPLSALQTWRFCKWCWMYSPEVCGPCAPSLAILDTRLSVWFLFALHHETGQGHELRRDESCKQRQRRERLHQYENKAEHQHC